MSMHSAREIHWTKRRNGAIDSHNTTLHAHQEEQAEVTNKLTVQFFRIRGIKGGSKTERLSKQNVDGDCGNQIARKYSYKHCAHKTDIDITTKQFEKTIMVANKNEMMSEEQR